MQNLLAMSPDDRGLLARCSEQRPVVIIEQNQSNLDELVGLYLGLADIILVPNAYIGLRMINLFKSENVPILAVEGLFGYGSSLQQEGAIQVWAS
ncbi:MULTISPECIES: hypothetical protein [Thalassospira]|uniref:Uncharacterized protein n=2 Tax=Thalassospira TaxID=168934 RepID=A0A367WC04_9PROT|nr:MULTISPECIES: hypothetical protein [Thalassospira]MDG4717630.1 hypothetical protein [Thalassospira sp. FZY0004]RCK38907.1 hypothetical protein TH19_03680 [Thalassospira profundimaris]